MSTAREPSSGESVEPTPGASPAPEPLEAAPARDAAARDAAARDAISAVGTSPVVAPPAGAPPASASPVESTSVDPARVAAFFDVDNTIIRGASAFHLAIGLYRRDFFKIRDLVYAALAQWRFIAFGESREQISSMRDRALNIIKGHTVAEVTVIGEEVYDQVLSLRIFPGTRKILDAHLAAGHQVWLITATPIEIGELIARHLGATGALGTIAEHEDGVYTGRLVGEMMHGKSKAAGARELADRLGLDLAHCYAYGDSANDIPILSSVGHPCAINPEARLRRHAKDVGWPVREFRGKRRLAKRGVKTASAAGLVWFLSQIARAIRRAIAQR